MDSPEAAALARLDVGGLVDGGDAVEERRLLQRPGRLERAELVVAVHLGRQLWSRSWGWQNVMRRNNGLGEETSQQTPTAAMWKFIRNL